jgi:hypothetical protein
LRIEGAQAARRQHLKASHEELTQRIHREEKELRDDMLERRHSTVRRLNEKLYKMSVVWDHTEVQRLIDDFAHEASFLYAGHYWSEDMHVQEWFDQMLLRYRELSLNEDGGQAFQPFWVTESKDRTMFLADASRRLQFWARGDIGAIHLKDDFRSLLALTGMPPYVSERPFASPWIMANPVELAMGEPIEPHLRTEDDNPWT